MTAHLIIDRVADLNGIPASVITSHSYHNDYSWERISNAKKQASYLLSLHYSTRQIMTFLGYSSLSRVKKNIKEMKQKVNPLVNPAILNELISMMQ